ncbi:hypothetical protein EMGBS8_02660 [Verrucomicrobiota bacterium]|nr:hypothetical protein EMGBS8_02660 [Verrucomicrobiota bacterium]
MPPHFQTHGLAPRHHQVDACTGKRDAQLGEKPCASPPCSNFRLTSLPSSWASASPRLAAFSDVTAEDLVGTSITEDEFNTVLASVAKAKTAGQA